jgi:cytochrome c553
MNKSHILLAASLAIASTACTNLERSRSLANPNVAPAVTAVQVCSNCHGIDGNSESPNFPRLSGQQPAYLAAQLQNFRSHQRSDPAGYFYMYGMSQKLTDEQIQGLADYYSKQIPKPIMAKVDSGKVLEGKEIFEKGVPAKEVPPCMACHGPNGEGMATFPRLANQHQDYMVKQLDVFQDNGGRPNTPMTQVAHGLSLPQIDAVASYLQAMPVNK